MNVFRKSLLAAGLASLMAFPVLADKVIMKDGRVIEGEVIEQTEHYVKVKVTFGTAVKTEVLWMGEVAEIKKDGGSTGTDQKQTGGETGKSDAQPKASGSVTVETSKAVSPNNPGVLVLPLKEMVGIYFRAEEIERVGHQADKILKETGKAPIIVLQIESGGGLVSEMEEIHETLTELKKRHRVVAWIKEAISAACATAIHCDEIYFMTEGTAGAMTAFAGTVSLKGEARNEWLRNAGQWARIGGRSPYIAHAMIGNEFELSYDKDDATGEVTWYDDLSGEHVLSRPGQNLTFTSSTALHSGFADGVADTPSELASLLDLPEWYEVSDYGRKIHEDWIDTIESAKKEVPKILGMIQIIQGSGAADEREKIGRTIREYGKLLRWWDRCPEVLTYEIPAPAKEDVERMIEDLRRRLGDLNRQDRGGGGRGR